MQKKFSIKGIDQLQLLGFQDANLRLIQQHFNAKITVRGSIVSIEGTEQEVREIEKLFSELIMLVNHNGGVTRKDVETLINLIRTEKNTAKQHVEDLSSVILSTKSGFIRPKTPGQQRYYRSTLKNDIVFVIGPAGTGKTYLAVAIAVAHLKAGEVERLILTRPAVEARNRNRSTGIYAGTHTKQCVCHLGRSSKYLCIANENVFDSAWG